MVPGDEIDRHMTESEVGTCEAVEGEMEGVHYNFWCMKEREYTMKMMAMGGKLLSDDTCRETSRTWKEAGVDVTKRFWYSHTIGISSTTMQLMVTTIYAIGFHL